MDTLPSPRRTVWVGKAVAGGVLTAGQCLAIALVAVGVGEHRRAARATRLRVHPGPGRSAGLRVGDVRWGSRPVHARGGVPGEHCFSRRRPRPPGSLRTDVRCAGFHPAVRHAAVHVLRVLGRGRPGRVGRAVHGTGPAPDRRPPVARDGCRHRTGGRYWAGCGPSTWLTARQAVLVWPARSPSPCSPGGVMLAPDVHPLFIWPGATLALGVLAGVTTVGEEQVAGWPGFWAERRLPLGRLWAVKTGAHFALAVAAAAVVGVFVVAASPHVPFHSPLLRELLAGVRPVPDPRPRLRVCRGSPGRHGLSQGHRGRAGRDGGRRHPRRADPPVGHRRRGGRVAGVGTGGDPAGGGPAAPVPVGDRAGWRPAARSCGPSAGSGPRPGGGGRDRVPGGRDPGRPGPAGRVRVRRFRRRSRPTGSATW